MKYAFILILFLFFHFNLKAQTQTFDNYFKAGIAKLEKNDFTGAVVEFTIAMEIEPRKKGFLYLAHAKRKIEDYEGAIKVYSDLLSMDSTDATVFNNRGNLKDELLQTDEAIKDYDHAIRLDSEYTEAYFNRAIANYNLKKYELCKEDFLKVLDLTPTDGEAMLGLGLAEKELGNKIQACKYFLEAQKAGADDAQKYWEEFCREN
jgi:tetratricopeptide (TPR) repeat protein